jgi:quercetin dioxygenase-like cupin family protein
MARAAFSLRTHDVAYDSIAPGASVHEHRHEEKEVWNVLEGELEITLAGGASRVQAGQVAVVPGGQPHIVGALQPCRVIVVDYPVRTSVGGLDTGSLDARDRS